MQKHSGFSGSVAALLVIDAMAVPDFEITRRERLDVWIEFSQAADCSLNSAARSRISNTERGNTAAIVIEPSNWSAEPGRPPIRSIQLRRNFTESN